MEPNTKSKPTLSFSKVAKALSNVSTRSQGNTNDGQVLQEQLSKAEPAEFLDRRHADAQENPATCQSDPRDGLWLCCCSRENSLTHYQGRYPFKHLQCVMCSHVMCPSCMTTEILTPIKNPDMEVFEERFKQSKKGGRYCRLCRACGLTHRQVFNSDLFDSSKTLCPCGQPAIEEGSFFHIGSVDEWRSEPEVLGAAMSLGRRLAAAEQISKANTAICRPSESTTPRRPVTAVELPALPPNTAQLRVTTPSST
ncbi:hypothetical protein EJ02DRAFT_488279 [Clathrospora elynae]|uniref:Probable double zinc ribbon domain-containing protein n=1 Tax=Clathrospora elynae TaxID=706981 RepID=A0A6A5SST2_9PLEO|nr:hypothetical protein EJ02DRAFT_488279 [Clathrospora elynae]